MLPIGSLFLTELFATLTGKATEHRIPEPASLMTDRDQVDAYVQAYVWNGPTSALLLYNRAEQPLPKPFQFHKSFFIDFYFLLQRGRKPHSVDPGISIQLRRKESKLRYDRKLELASLRHLAKSKSFD